MVQFCVAILEMLHSTHGKKILILRQRNLSKHCLIRFLFLSNKIPSLHVSQSTSETVPCITFVLSIDKWDVSVKGNIFLKRPGAFSTLVNYLLQMDQWQKEGTSHCPCQNNWPGWLPLSFFVQLLQLLSFYGKRSMLLLHPLWLHSHLSAQMCPEILRDKSITL